MEFSNFNIESQSDGSILVWNQLPILNIEKLKWFKEDLSGTFSSKELRWSYDKSYWSNPIPLTPIALTNIKMAGNDYLYLEITYNPASSNDFIRSLTISYVSKDIINKFISTNYKYSTQYILEQFIKGKRGF